MGVNSANELVLIRSLRVAPVSFTNDGLFTTAQNTVECRAAVTAPLASLRPTAAGEAGKRAYIAGDDSCYETVL